MKSFGIALIAAVGFFSNTAVATEIDVNLGRFDIEIQHEEAEYFASIGLFDDTGIPVAVLTFHNSPGTVPDDALYFDSNTKIVWSHYPADRFSDVKEMLEHAASVRLVYSDFYNSFQLQTQGGIGT